METTCKIDRPGRPENDDLVVPKTPRPGHWRVESWNEVQNSICPGAAGKNFSYCNQLGVSRSGE